MPTELVAHHREANEFWEQQFQEDLRTGFAEQIHQAMLKIGVPPRLHKAVTDKVPAPISDLACWRAFPQRNFGLVGPAGCGKSMAMAVQIAQTLRREITEAGPRHYAPGKDAPQQVAPKLKTEWRWICWPAYAIRMRGLSARRLWDDQDASTNVLITWLTTSPSTRVLILDDVGEEGFKESRTYTNEQLELLLDEAYGYECRLFWTSNHKVQELDSPQRYDTRLVSRLIGLAPDVVLPDTMPDLRIRNIV